MATHTNACGVCGAVIRFQTRVDPRTSATVIDDRLVTCSRCGASFVLWVQTKPRRVKGAHLQPMLKAAAAELDRRKTDPTALIHYDQIACTAVAGAADAPPEREARQHCVDEVCRYLLTCEEHK